MHAIYTQHTPPKTGEPSHEKEMHLWEILNFSFQPLLIKGVYIYP